MEATFCKLEHALLSSTLEIALQGFQIQKFSGGAGPQTPPPPKKVPCFDTVSYSN